jgi:hypothetical protein
MCEALKDHVDNIGMSGKIATSKVDGVEIGYRVMEFTTFLKRQVFVKTPGYDIGEIGKDDKEKIMAAVFNVFLVPGANMPDINQIAPDCILLQQDVIPMIMVEKNPRLRSIAGGLG